MRKPPAVLARLRLGLRGRCLGAPCWVIAVAAAVALAREAVMLSHIGLRMLWGGDAVPVFNVAQVLRDTLTAAMPWRSLGLVYVPQLSVLLLSGGPRAVLEAVLPSTPSGLAAAWHAANTLGFFLALLALYYAVSSLRLAVREAVVAYAAASAFFAFNPWSTIDTFKSYLGATSIQSALFIALAGYYLRIAAAALGGPRLTRRDLLLALASASLLYMQSPSSAARGILEVALLALPLVPVAAASAVSRRLSRRCIAFGLAPFLPVLVSALFVPLLGYMKPLAGRVEAVWGGATPPEKFLRPAYATPVTAIEGMNTWIAFSEYMPYGELYQEGLLAALMMLWPLTLGVVVLLAARRGAAPGERGAALYLATLFLVAATWGSALNALMVPLKVFLVERFPLIVKILYWGVTIKYVRAVYILAAAYTVARLSRVSPPAAVILAAVLLSTSLPIFTGRVFSQYYNETIKGILLPEDYLVLRGLHVDFYSHILVAPDTGTYAMTRWGYQGSTTWYHTLNTATLVRPLAPYAQYTSWTHLYAMLATPCIETDSALQVVARGGAEILDTTGGQLVVRVRNSGTLTLTGPARLREGDVVGFYVARLEGSKPVSLELTVSGANISERVRALIPRDMNETWRLVVADQSSEVKRLAIQVKIVDGGEALLAVRLLFGRPVGVCSEWIRLLYALRVEYLVLDKSIVSKRYTSTYYSVMEAVLNETFHPVYRGRWLTIYSVASYSGPFAELGGEASVSYLELGPRQVTAILNCGEGCRAQLGLPLLSATRGFFTGSGFAAAVWNSLMVAEVVSAGETTLVLRYAPGFLAVYYLYVAYMFIPLALLAAAAAAHVRAEPL